MIKKVAILGVCSLFAAQSLFAQQPDLKQEKLPFSSTESFFASGASSKKNEKQQYSSNIIRIAPFSALDIGTGIGASYEKVFNKGTTIGLVLPFNVLFDPDNSFSSNNAATYLYFTPGIKIYPFGQRRFTYSVGPNLMFGYGKAKEWRYDGVSSFSEQADVTRFRLGMLITNYLGINVAKNFTIGVEGGVGARYYEQTTVKYLSSGYSNSTGAGGVAITGQFNFNFGFRF